ncbi:MAG TPA: anti-sigma factor [Aliidongia sp.]|nr:anti-sigma factor [Aliidongia sp.]
MTSDRPITDEDLQAHIDNRLDQARQAEVSDYLDRHPEMANRISGYATQRDALRAALVPIAEEPIPPELNLARLIEARRRSQGWRTGWRSAAAAVLILVLGGAGGWSLHGASMPAPSGVTALALEAADSYSVYAPDHIHPVEFRAGDQKELVSWLSSRLERPVAVPDLTASGYRFMGGRLVPTEHGPAALFLYDDDHGSRLAMMARPMTTVDRDAPMSAHSKGSVSGYAWASKGLGYSLMGGPAATDLHPIANEARRQINEQLQS